MKKYSLFLTILLLVAMTITSNASTYYSVSDGDANNLNTWWTNRNGTGTHPTNFTMAEDIFTIQEGVSTWISTDWTVAGTIKIEENGLLSAPNQPYNLAINTLTVEQYGQFICGSSLVVSGATYSDGDIELRGTDKNYTFADITLHYGNFWDQSAGTSTVTINGDFINNLFAVNFDASKSQYKFSGSNKTLSGTSSIPRVEFTGNYTNNGTLTCATELTVTGASVDLTNNGTITASTALSGTGEVIQGSSGVLNIAGTSGITLLNASAHPGNTVNYTGAAQTGKATRYSNLTLSGSGEKTFATTPEISGILSLEGTASVVVTTGVVTYGSEATLQYNKSGAYTATTEEWITPFEARGGIIINNTGAITPPASSTIGYGSMLTIKSGASIVTNSPTYNSGSKLKYEGNSAQTTTTIELPETMDGGVVINNSAGVVLGRNTTINGTLTFTAGNLTIGAYNLELTNTSGAAAGACVVTNSTGVVKKYLWDNESFTFPIGPSTTKYNPVTLNIISRRPVDPDDPGAYPYTASVANISPATPIPSNSLNYMWTLTGSAVSASLSFSWLNADAGSGLAADPVCGVAYIYNSAWTEVGGTTTTGTPNVTSNVNVSSPQGNWTIGGNFSAYSGSGSGLSGDPYLVATMENLAWISQNSTVWGRYFKQTAIIDAASTSDGGSGWLPIGNNTKKFRGTYDGQGYTISGLYINRPTADSVGLFGCTLGGTISNLKLTDLNIQGHYFVGGLVGNNDNTDISKCSSTGTVSGSAMIGGLAGQIINSAVDKCFSTVSVNCSVSYLGGFAAIIDNTSVSNCYATGSVNGPSSGTARAGGFLGYLNPGGTIDKCYSTGLVTAVIDLVGGFLGGNSNAPGEEVTNSFWDKDASLPTSPAGGIGKTTAEMKTQSTFTDAGWDNIVWNMESGINNGYPYLDWQNPDGSPLPVNLVNYSATLTEDKVTLNWQTETEVNNYGFQVERQKVKGESEWEVVGFVEGHGNSNSPKDYTFTDDLLNLNPDKSGQALSLNLNYRLKQLDFDGNYEYSDVVEVKLAENIKAYKLEQNYPNPFNPSTKIIYNIPNDGLVSLIIYDVLGNEVVNLVHENQIAGSYEILFNSNRLSSGVYICKMSCDNFTSSIKMLVLK